MSFNGSFIIKLLVAIMLLADIAATVQTNPQVCYQGWTREGTRCYRAFTSPVTWQTAVIGCQEMKSSLLIVNDAEEQQFIQNFILQLRPVDYANIFWIGLKKNGSAWNLTDGSQTSTLLEPFDGSKANNSQQCGVTNKDGVWLPDNCNERRPYFCETDTISCPVQEDWHAHKERCLKVMSAWTEMTWHSARLQCRNLSADLAVFYHLNNLTMEPFLMSQIKLVGKWHWVGMQYRSDIHDYSWLDGRSGSLPDVTTATSPQLESARCGAISTDQISDEILTMRAACNTTMGFICQLSYQAESCRMSAPAYVCTDGSCIDAVHLCDGRIHCADGSDESPDNCGKGSTTVGVTTTSTNVRVSRTTLQGSIVGTTSAQATAAMSSKDKWRPIVSKRSSRKPRSASSQFFDNCKLVNGTWRCYIFGQGKPESIDNETRVDTSVNYEIEDPSPDSNKNYKTGTNRDSATAGETLPALPGGRNHQRMPNDTCRQALNTSRQALGTSQAAVLASGADSGNQRAKPRYPVGRLVPSAFLTILLSSAAPGTVSLSTKASTSSNSQTITASTQVHVSTKTPEVEQAVTSGSSPGDFSNIAYEPNITASQCLRHGVFTDDTLCGNNEKFRDEMGAAFFRRSSILNNNSSQWLLKSFIEVINDVIGPNNSSSCGLEEVLEKLDLSLETFAVSTQIDAMLNVVLSDVEIDVQTRHVSSLPSFRFEGHIAGCAVSNISLQSTDGEDNTTKSGSISVAIFLTKLHTTVVKLKESDEGTVYICSPVLSVSAYHRGQRTSLKHTFRLPQVQKQSMVDEDHWNSTIVTMHCAYYEVDVRIWSTKGCVVDRSDDFSTTCSCNHTTNFAVLMQIVDIEISEEHEIALSVITYIGCSVSLLTMFIAITVFTCVRSLNSERVSVHRNLCLAIVAAQVTFLAGIKANQSKLVCRLVAVVLHYCYTAVFMWMLVEGLHLYTKVVQVFGTEKSRVTYYLWFGWGIPFILVLISAVADWEGYGTERSCWLSIKRKTVWAFVGPAIAVIIVNLFILSIVLRIVISSSKLDQHGKYDHIRAGLKGALFLLPLLGLTWLFGLLAVNEDLITFEYLFAVFNSLQGFFIFLFHCALNSEVREALQRMREKRALQRWDCPTTSGVSTSTPSASCSPSPSSDDPAHKAIVVQTSKPSAMTYRLKAEYINGVKLYRPIQVAPLNAAHPDALPVKTARTNSQDSSRTKETDISNTGRSPDCLLEEEEELALIYI